MRIDRLQRPADRGLQPGELAAYAVLGATYGDALTDVAAGRAFGARTVLMLTGVTSRETADALPVNERPTKVAAHGEDLARVLAELAADG